MNLADIHDAKEILISYILAGKGPDSKNQLVNAWVLGEMLKIIAKAVSESINRR
jgi:hypothetical protein